MISCSSILSPHARPTPELLPFDLYFELSQKLLLKWAGRKFFHREMDSTPNLDWIRYMDSKYMQTLTNPPQRRSPTILNPKSPITFAYRISGGAKRSQTSQKYWLPAIWWLPCHRIDLVCKLDMSTIYFHSPWLLLKCWSSSSVRSPVDWPNLWSKGGGHWGRHPLKVGKYSRRLVKIARSDDGAYKPRPLRSLMPFLIASHPTEILPDDSQRENLETYVSCLSLYCQR